MNAMSGRGFIKVVAAVLVVVSAHACTTATATRLPKDTHVDDTVGGQGEGADPTRPSVGALEHTRESHGQSESVARERGGGGNIDDVARKDSREREREGNGDDAHGFAAGRPHSNAFAFAPAPAPAASPTAAAWGLMVDLKPSPSLGVSRRPSFSWIVPTALSLGVGQRQIAYQLAVASTNPTAQSDAVVAKTRRGLHTAASSLRGHDSNTLAAPVVVWDSGWVRSSEQSFVQCNVTLAAAGMFTWSVAVELTDDNGASSTASSNNTSATFITSLDTWDTSTTPIWAALTPPPPPPPPPPPSPPAPPPSPPGPHTAAGRFIKGCNNFHVGMTCSSPGCGVPGTTGYPQGSMWCVYFHSRAHVHIDMSVSCVSVFLFFLTRWFM
jgi:hypothetical protein